MNASLLATVLVITLTGNTQALAGDRWISHEIRPGETLQTISKKYYGTTRRWLQIFRANTKILTAPEQAEPGMHLRLKVKDKEVTHAAVAHAAPNLDSMKEVRVREGDTVQSLAADYMGSTKFWPRIIALNRGIIREPEDLRPGMRIRIQELPHASRPAAAAAGAASVPLEQYSAVDVGAGAREVGRSPASVPAPQAVEQAPRTGLPSTSILSTASKMANGTQASKSALPHFDEFIDP